MYRVTKTYGHDLGLSACFRQWRAESHCRFVHGYALAFTLIFEAKELDENGWVIDFGSLKPIKEMLVETFDHKLVVAMDDPELDTLSSLMGIGCADVLVLEEGVGCERFARRVFRKTNAWMYGQPDLHIRNVRLVSVECREHGANSATYVGAA